MIFMKADVFSVEGKKLHEMELPGQFSAQYNEGLIRRAVLAIQSAGVQQKAPYVLAGRHNTSVYVGARGKPAMYRGINVEKARKPRLKNRRFLISGQGAGIPAVVGGPKAHPPKIEKVWEEKINAKEKKAATESAIAATGNIALVKARGHLVPEGAKLPFVVEQKFEDISRTKDVVAVLEKLGLFADVEKVKSKRKIRAGKGKKRGRVHKVGKSVLIIAADTSKIFRAERNISGVEVAEAKGLNADILAPGATAGRLALWTEGAIKALAEGIKTGPDSAKKAKAEEKKANVKENKKPKEAKGKAK